MVLLFPMYDLCYANHFAKPIANAYTWAVIAYFSAMSTALEHRGIQ